MTYNEIEERYNKIYEKINQVNPDAKIIGVTKTNPVDIYFYAHRLGIHDIGENRIQELMEKRHAFEKEVKTHQMKFHFIGQLQKNKAKYFSDNVDSYDSLSSESIFEILQKKWKSDVPLKVLLQINASMEDQKNGIPLDDIKRIYSIVELILEVPKFSLEGLMTMGPTPDKNYTIHDKKYIQDTENAFRKLRQLKDRIKKDYEISLPRLSMGMSHDYLIALNEGSTEVRIGSAIFGERNTTLLDK